MIKHDTYEILVVKFKNNLYHNYLYIRKNSNINIILVILYNL